MQSITILQLTHSETAMELKNQHTSESKHPSLLAYSSMALMKNGDENEQGDEDKVTDVRALLAQKEKDLILAAELGKDGVRVNAIGPGLIETPLNENARANNPELIQTFMDHTPLGRAGKPEDIVGPAVFLASDLGAYVTGGIVMADGGYRTI